MELFLIVLVIVLIVMFLWLIGWGIFWFLVQAGVIAQKALEPPTTDTRSFNLDQSREVKSEEQ